MRLKANRYFGCLGNLKTRHAIKMFEKSELEAHQNLLQHAKQELPLKCREHTFEKN